MGNVERSHNSGSTADVPRSSSSISISGAALLRLRQKLAYTQDEFARLTEVSRASIQSFERSDVARIQVKKFRVMAERLGTTVESLQRQLAATSVPPFEGGIGAPVPVPTVPRFTSGLTASRAEMIDEPVQRGVLPVPVDGRAFVVNVIGDCMSPTFNDGELVVFSVDAVSTEGVADGTPCYVQLADGRGAFKLLYRDLKREGWSLRCINRKKYPKEIFVPDQELVRVAKAVGKYLPFNG